MKETIVTATVKIAAVTAAITLGISLTGCLSPTQTVITDYGADGKIVKETVTSESVIKSVTDSTKDKSVIVWESGWIAYMSATTATAENPSPTFKLGAGKVDKGAITLHKDHKNFPVADIIKATRSELEVSATGLAEKKQ